MALRRLDLTKPSKRREYAACGVLAAIIVSAVAMMIWQPWSGPRAIPGKCGTVTYFSH